MEPQPPQPNPPVAQPQVPNNDPDRKQRLQILNSIVPVILLMLAGGALAAVALPNLLKSGSTPSFLVFLSVWAVLVLLTAMVLKVVIRYAVGLSARWFWLTLAYSALILLVKFVLAPASLYQQNSGQAFDAGVLDPNTTEYYLVVAVIIGALYMLAFKVLQIMQKGYWSTHKHKGPNKRAVTIGVAMLALVVLLAMGGGAFIIFPYMFAIGTFNYLNFIFTSVLGYAILVALITALVLASTAINQSIKDGNSAGQTTTAAVFFSVGMGLLVVFHILWVVYMATLVTLWPFKTYTPK